MLITLLRVFILYVIVVFAVRLMGKRQIGELQPSELVVTFLLSEIAAVPMQDNEIPMMNSIVALLMLVSLEIVSSVILLKSKKFRTITEGKPIVVVKNGEIDTRELKKLRFTVDDIHSALRQKDVFDLSTVQYAIVETNGNVSVMLNDSSGSSSGSGGSSSGGNSSGNGGSSSGGNSSGNGGSSSGGNSSGNGGSPSGGGSGKKKKKK